jgi:hypothetical protein
MIMTNALAYRDKQFIVQDLLLCQQLCTVPFFTFFCHSFPEAVFLVVCDPSVNEL